MLTALRLAALSGVDVRIITPGIPDKKYVYLVTNSFYGALIQAGAVSYTHLDVYKRQAFKGLSGAWRRY